MCCSSVNILKNRDWIVVKDWWVLVVFSQINLLTVCQSVCRCLTAPSWMRSHFFWTISSASHFLPFLREALAFTILTYVPGAPGRSCLHSLSDDATLPKPAPDFRRTVSQKEIGKKSHLPIFCECSCSAEEGLTFMFDCYLRKWTKSGVFLGVTGPKRQLL